MSTCIDQPLRPSPAKSPVDSLKIPEPGFARSREGSPLQSKVALFNNVVNKHIEKQAYNPFSNDSKPGSLPRPQISREDYGKPVKGSQSETRGFKATQHVCKEMLELCEVINQCGEPLFTEKEKPGDHRKVISFGELFGIYTSISDKVVGILLRTRKYKFVEFEGEVLFQRRDDHVPIILVKPISEIRQYFKQKIEEAKAAQKANEDMAQQQNMPMD